MRSYVCNSFNKSTKSQYRIINKSVKVALLSVSFLSTGAMLPALANEPVNIPLQFMWNADSSYISRLGIWASLNGGEAQRYMFDTGSDMLQTQINRPVDGVVPVGERKLYGYGDGTYGYVFQKVQYANMSYFDQSDTQNAVVTLGGGYEAGHIIDNVYTLDSVYAKGKRLTDTPVFSENGKDYYADLEFREKVEANLPADEGGLFSGTYGSGDFLMNGSGDSSLLGGRTTSGYIMAANSSHQQGVASTPGCAPCVILNLDASLRSQFTTLIPWGDIDLTGYHDPLPGSGANGSVQYKGVYTFEFTVPGQEEPIKWTGPVMLDTGVASTVLLENTALIQQLKDSGVVFDDNGQANIQNLIVTAEGGEAVNIGESSLNYMAGRTTQGLIIGLPFFLQRSVMYDLEGKQSGYSQYFVTAENFTTDPTQTNAIYLGPITQTTGNAGFLGVAGSISGAGALYLEPHTSVRLSGNNTYTGLTYISKDAVLSLAGPGRIEQSADVAAHGTFDISQRGNALAGWGVDDSENDASIRSLSGTGTVSLGNRTLYITNAFGNFTGEIHDLDSQDVSQGGSLTIAGGTQWLTGKNTYSGMTSVMSDATLILGSTGSIDSDAAISGALYNHGNVYGAVTATDGALIGGSGVFALVDVEAGAQIAPSPDNGAEHTGATLSVSGDFTQRSGSLYRMNILGDGTSDHIAVGGGATIEDNASLLIGKRGAGFVKLGTHYTVLTAANGITGAYASVDDTIEQDAPFLTYSLYNNPNSISIEIERSNVAFADVVSSQNAKSVARAADRLAQTNQVYGNIVGLNALQAQTAFNLLSGEVHAATGNALFEGATVLQDMAGERIRTAFGGARPAALPVMAYGPTGPVEAGSQAEKYAVWGRAFHNRGHMDGNGNSARLGNSATGFVAGIDTALSDWRIGALAGYSQTSFDVAERSSSGKSRNLNVGVYAGTQMGAVGLRAGAAYTWHDIETKRHVAFANLSETLAAGYHAGTFQAFGEIGYRFEMQRVALEPYVNLAYVHLRTDGFREAGGASALSVEAKNNNAGLATLGVRASTDFDLQGTKLSVNGGVAWRHVAGSFGSDTRMAFANGSGFAVEGVAIARNAALLEAGLDIEISRSAKFGLSYNGQLSERAQQHSGNARFSIRF